MLGLLRSFGVIPQLEVKEDMRVCSLYMHTTELIYKEEGNLNFLRLIDVSRSIEHKREFDLPSWVINFNVSTKHLPIFGKMRYAPKRADKVKCSRELSGTFAFTGNSQSSCKFNPTVGTITVVGFRVDTVQRIGTRVVDIMPSFKANYATMYEKRICWLPYDEAEESKLEEIWDSFLGHEPSGARTWINAENVSAKGDLPRTVNTQCFGTTHFGLTGITDAAICVGDTVCGLLGLGVPCILRRQENLWRFVGLR
jgi:hypothetical protein